MMYISVEPNYKFKWIKNWRHWWETATWITSSSRRITSAILWRNKEKCRIVETCNMRKLTSLRTIMIITHRELNQIIMGPWVRSSHQATTLAALSEKVSILALLPRSRADLRASATSSILPKSRQSTSNSKTNSNVSTNRASKFKRKIERPIYRKATRTKAWMLRLII